MTEKTYEKIIQLMKQEGVERFAIMIGEINGMNLDVNFKTHKFPTRDLGVLRQETSKLIHAVFEEETAPSKEKELKKDDKVASATKNMLE